MSANRCRVAGKRRLVVVGNGMAGMRAVEELLAVAPKAYDITVFGSEPHGNYNRILLSPVLAGEKTRRGNRHQSARLVSRTRHHTAHRRSGGRHRSPSTHRSIGSRSRDPYDRLLLATGSNPIVLPVPGHDLPGVVTFRDLQDVDAMLHAAGTYRQAVVIGGGLLGLEAANGAEARHERHGAAPARHADGAAARQGGRRVAAAIAGKSGARVSHGSEHGSHCGATSGGSA